ncbi:MAG: peptidyl-prolyl cis-trans isomerase [Cytophagales bacterium]|nr:peptidyl-prolyl cis-trans isomerase [Armatimonadota bacterium]
MKKFFIVLLLLVTAASLAGNLFLYQRYSTSRPVMQIGTDGISVKEYRDSLEYQFGKPVLTKIAITKIVMNAAKKAGVTPGEKDVDSRLSDIERRMPERLEMARKDPVKMADLRRDLKADIALENLSMKEVKLSETEIRDFYRRNPARFRVPTQAQTTMIVAQNSVDAATAEALMKEKGMTPANIASSQPRLRVVGLNFSPNWGALPAEARARLSSAVMATSVGGIKKVAIQNLFFVVRVDKRASEGVVPFEKARSQAERFARLAKAPRREVVVTRLYKEANVQFEMPRYASYFQEIEAASRNVESAALQTR